VNALRRKDKSNKKLLTKLDIIILLLLFFHLLMSFYVIYNLSICYHYYITQDVESRIPRFILMFIGNINIYYRFALILLTILSLAIFLATRRLSTEYKIIVLVFYITIINLFIFIITIDFLNIDKFPFKGVIY